MSLKTTVTTTHPHLNTNICYLSVPFAPTLPDHYQVLSSVFRSSAQVPYRDCIARLLIMCQLTIKPYLRNGGRDIVLPSCHHLEAGRDA